MVYVKNGNLYLQIGWDPPMQLTDSGMDLRPVFSNDGKQIVFLRGLIPRDVYVITTDGGRERALVTGSQLAGLGLGYGEFTEIESLMLVPGTHRVLFNTVKLDPLDVEMKDFSRPGAVENNDLLLADADTGEIRRLLPPGGGGSFRVSPDGKRVAILGTDHIDVIDIDGQAVFPDLLTYSPVPWPVSSLYWAQDSSQLIVLLPIITGNALDSSGPEPRTIRKYPMHGGPSTELRFDPAPIGNDVDYRFSPDGQWILYRYYSYGGQTDETVTAGLYLGNLRDGGSQWLMPGIPSCDWSPDSEHFVCFDDSDQLYLGSVYGPPAFVDEGRFLGWADAGRWISCCRESQLVIHEIDGGENFVFTNQPESMTWFDSGYLDLIYTAPVQDKEN